jgi:hypothetical protein
MAMSNLKRQKVARMKTSAIETILNTLAGPELEPPSQERPLGGQVQISGIGAVPVPVLRQELTARQRVQDEEMLEAHAEGLHDDVPREFCPNCDNKLGRV